MDRILFRAGVRQHKGTLLGIFVLVFLVMLSFGTLVTVQRNSATYIREELERIGYGDVTFWVEGTEAAARLPKEIEQTGVVQSVQTDALLFTNYELNAIESDSEGQAIRYESSESRYRFFTDDGSGYQAKRPEIAPGEVYVPIAFVSMYQAKIGDTLICHIARNSGNAALTIKGFFEDPIMGSSMIGMKSFLVHPADYERMQQMAAEAGIDALAKDGVMLHVTGTGLTAAALTENLNKKTTLANATKFSHSKDTIYGFMLVLQNACSGFLLAFVLVLVVVVFLVLAHAIRGGLERDYADIGRLKTMGICTEQVRRTQVRIYATAIVPGMVFGMGAVPFCVQKLSIWTITTTGIQVGAYGNFALLCLACGIGLIMFCGGIYLLTKRIAYIPPLAIIYKEQKQNKISPDKRIHGKYLAWSLAIRQIVTAKRNYISVGLTALLLVFFASVVGRMQVWLGSDGKGMMDAFNPADHDIGVQMFGDSSDADARNVIEQYTNIVDTYALAMPDVTINGTGYTANVITDPSRFHLLQGTTCLKENEIVITEFTAKDYQVTIGDTLTVRGDSGSSDYIISGIYSCANDMGNTIGMNREGYLAIGRDDRRIWCQHYFLEHPEVKYQVTEALKQQFGGDVHVHENTWPGLFGIIAAMRAMLAVMYVFVALFIFIATALAGGRLIGQEQQDLGIYKALGFSQSRLRLSFALRFAVVSTFGAGIGMVTALVFADTLIAQVMKWEGISNFAAHPSVLEIVFPAAVVVVIFLLCAYFIGRNIKKVTPAVLVRE